MTDPIADMLTRIRNAIMAGHESVIIPGSKVKLAITRLIKEEGFIQDYEVIKGKPDRVIKVRLKYYEDGKPAINGMDRISKPGLRVYVEHDNVPRVYGGIGVAIVSTSKGVKTGQQAKRLGVGGEVLCHIW